QPSGLRPSGPTSPRWTSPLRGLEGSHPNRSPFSLEELLARLTLAGFIPPEERPLALRQPAMRQLFRLFLLHARLTLSYEPRALAHRLTLLKATDLRGRAARDPTQGWRMLAAHGVEVHRLPGEHLTLLREPHVGEVARVLGECLRRAEEEGAG
ncbi:hypothetical protein L6R53_28890, partial [Myxococcota bacterium]|nr:hypothetical protein [Myxococcota bacterium]